MGGTNPTLIDRNGEQLFTINFGKQVMREGKSSIYRDYIQAHFDKPLEKGIYYLFTADIKTNTDATIGISDFEVYFGDGKVERLLSPMKNKGLKPQIRLQDEIIPYAQFDYRKKWKTVKRYYKAEGGERYLIIGNFTNKLNGFSNISGDVFNTKTGNLPNSSYLLRQVSLVKIPPPKNYQNEIPNSVKAGDKITLNTIRFAVNQATIEKASFPEVKKLAATLVANKAKVHIIGHTDANGKADSNMRLSENRAQALKQLLQRFGVSEDQISTEGQGETQPIADNASAKGRAQNRRVEIKVLGSK